MVLRTKAKIAEMKTPAAKQNRHLGGLPCRPDLNALNRRRGATLVTVERLPGPRDGQSGWARCIASLASLGGLILTGHAPVRATAHYGCDITYATTVSWASTILRDNMSQRQSKRLSYNEASITLNRWRSTLHSVWMKRAHP